MLFNGNKIFKIGKVSIFYRLLLIITDIVLINLALYLAFSLRFDGNIPAKYFALYKDTYLFVTLIIIISLFAFNLYDRIWKFASVNELLSIALATLAGNIAILGYTYISGNFYPRSIYIIFWMLLTGIIGLSRFSLRIYNVIPFIHKNNGNKRVLIVGAGQAGCIILKEFLGNPSLGRIPVAFIDDDKNKHGKLICGVRVVGGRDRIPEVVESKGVDEIVIAMPSVDRKEIRKIVDICSKTGCKIRILPGLYELIDGKVDVRKLRDVRIEDLLGREPIKIDIKKANSFLNNKVVMVTGGGGSIGSELCRQIAYMNPKQLLIFDINENNVFELEHELNKINPDLNYVSLIGSIRDRERLEAIVKTYHPDVIFHAAAHKHVPLMELNPTEAIKNNIFGTLNLVELADKYHVEKFILISTDKAVNPKNVMGASKRVAEIIIQMMAKKSKTVFAAVRFGNVLGSKGSVIPLFKKQIEEGGPVTVTHPDITRYFMTIPEAVQLVIQAGAMAKGGEIFVLDMGEPVKIKDLAIQMIKLSGLEPEKDIEIKYIGLRPGEKLYEELFYDKEEVIRTDFEKIFLVNHKNDYKRFKEEIESLKSILIKNDKRVELLIKNLENGFMVSMEQEMGEI